MLVIGGRNMEAVLSPVLHVLSLATMVWVLPQLSQPL